MKKNIFSLCSVLLIAFAAPNIASAQGAPKKSGLFFTEAHMSTLGLGAEVGYKVNKRWSVRAAAQGFNYDQTGTLDGVRYNFDYNWMGFGILADYFPFEDSGWHLTAGARYNGNEIDMAGAFGATDSVGIGNATFTGAQVGTLSGEVDYDSFAPYLGIGYRKDYDKNSPWFVNFEAGAMFQGDADVSLTSSGGAAVQAQLAQEERNLEDELEKYDIYPVVKLGMGYKF